MLGLWGCDRQSRTSELKSFKESVDRKGAEMVRAEISMGAGTLAISGGAEKLVDATFESDRVDPVKPEVRYDMSSFRGVLTIAERSGTTSGGNKNEWNLRFNNETPLDLRTLSLRNLDVAMGAGQVDLDISGEYKHSVNVNVNGGVGQATIHLPKSIGTRVDAKGGIGSVVAKNMVEKDGYYINEAYSLHNNGMNVKVRGGIGEIRLVVD